MGKGRGGRMGAWECGSGAEGHAGATLLLWGHAGMHRILAENAWYAYEQQ